MELHPNQPQIRGHYLTFFSPEESLSLTFFALAGEGSVISSSFFFALLAVAFLAAGFFVFAVALDFLVVTSTLSETSFVLSSVLLEASSSVYARNLFFNLYPFRLKLLQLALRPSLQDQHLQSPSLSRHAIECCSAD